VQFFFSLQGKVVAMVCVVIQKKTSDYMVNIKYTFMNGYKGIFAKAIIKANGPVRTVASKSFKPTDMYEINVPLSKIRRSMKSDCCGSLFAFTFQVTVIKGKLRASAKVAGAVNLTCRIPPKQCPGVKKYKVIMTYIWSSKTHPVDYPSNARFSPLVVASHNKYYTMWAPRSFANRGIQEIAETGATIAMINEVKSQANVYKYIQAPGTDDGTTTLTTMITARGKGYQTYLSSGTMLFPSPDWFTGFYNVNMCDNDTGKWLSSAEGLLIGWDSGTDSGKTFLAKNMKTSPPMPIHALSGFPSYGVPFGSWKIVKA